eukprot:s1202_g1.t1
MSPGCRDPQPLQAKDIQSLLRLNLSYIEPTSSGPAEILPHLFLGSRDDAVNLKVLKSLGITHVLNCAAATVHTGKDFYGPFGMGYSEFVAQDDLLAELAGTVAEKKGRLFVHCEAGVNRSGALCLAYHLSSSQMGLVDSAKHCKARRGRICTNPAFQMQVFGFARKRNLLVGPPLVGCVLLFAQKMQYEQEMMSQIESFRAECDQRMKQEMNREGLSSVAAEEKENMAKMTQELHDKLHEQVAREQQAAERRMADIRAQTEAQRLWKVGGLRTVGESTSTTK